MFWVVEIQCNGGKWSQLVTQHETRNLAESKFYNILSYASVSELDAHGAILFDDAGVYYKREVYYNENKGE